MGYEPEIVLDTRPPERRDGFIAAVSLAFALGSTVWAYVEYAGSARAPLLALALAGTFFGIAATVLFGFRFAFSFETVQGPRPAPPPAGAPVELTAGARRGFVALLGGAAASLLASMLLPVRSLGGSPRPTLERTTWRRGVRLVIAGQGTPIRPADLPPGSATPVVSHDAPDDTNSIAVLVRLRGSTELRAYSRICTHSGCAVCVFRSQQAELVCPCHYSVFDASAGGRVLSGPASKPLPELPLGVDDEGFVVAGGDFNRPIGPRRG